MLVELYLYMVILYLSIVFARRNCSTAISLLGAFIVATLTKLGSIGAMQLLPTVIYEAVMLVISYVVLHLVYNFTKMSRLGFIVEIIASIALVYIYFNLGTYIFNM